MQPNIKSDLKKYADPKKAEILRRFFKTGPGEYGEGDCFLGIVVPDIRKVSNKYIGLDLSSIVELLHSKYHEERLAALLIMVSQYRKGEARKKEKIFKIYLDNIKFINNWDLIDLTAPHIVGAYLDKKPKTSLFKLAGSENLWARRIAVLSSFYYIKNGDCLLTFELAEGLLSDKEDLIHKAVGWMLREAGKRCSENQLDEFLEKQADKMPRVMLRYSLEHFEESKKKYFMAKGKLNKK